MNVDWLALKRYDPWPCFTVDERAAVHVAGGVRVRALAGHGALHESDPRTWIRRGKTATPGPCFLLSTYSPSW